MAQETRAGTVREDRQTFLSFSLLCMYFYYCCCSQYWPGILEEETMATPAKIKRVLHKFMFCFVFVAFHFIPYYPNLRTVRTEFSCDAQSDAV